MGTSFVILPNTMDIVSPSISGYLFRKGYFQDWNRRYVELENNVISYSVVKGGVGYGSFKIGPNSKCEDNSLRPFCFTVTDNMGETYFFSAENIATKEAWTETIQASLSLLRLAERRLRSASFDHKKERELAISLFASRSMVYIKIIQARNLIAKDMNGFSDPYVKITVGSSSARTTTRKMNLDPDWGMVFPFEWDHTTRFAKIEVWDEDFSSADDFLGMVQIPLYSLKDGDAFTAWYGLGKRSTKSNVGGEIEVEVACSGTVELFQHTWSFFRMIQNLPEFSMNLASKVDGSGQIALKTFNRMLGGDSAESRVITPLPTEAEMDTDSTATASEGIAIATEDGSAPMVELKGFPIYFPPIETEILEDLSLKVQLMSVVNSNRVSTPGLLFLTNYRLIFISLTRIFENNFAMKVVNPSGFQDDLLKTLDLSTYIPICCIANIILTTESDGAAPGHLMKTHSYEAIRIKCVDCRTLSFLFKDDHDTKEASKTAPPLEPLHILNKAFDIYNNIINPMASSQPCDGNDSECGRPSGELQKQHSVTEASSRKFSSVDRKNSTSLDTDGTASRKGSNAMDVDPLQRKNSAAEGLHRKNSAADGVGELHRKGSTASIPDGLEVTAKRKKLRPPTVKRSVYHYFSKSEQRLKEQDPKSLEAALANLIKNFGFKIESLDSEEGPPAHRIYSRIKYRMINRGIERNNAINAHKQLLSALAHACEQVPAPPNSKTVIQQSTPFKNGEHSEEAGDIGSIYPEEGHAKPLPLGWTSNATDEAETLLSERDQLRNECKISGFEKNLTSSAELINAGIKLVVNLENSWNMFSPLLEFKRMGVPSEQWRISDVNAKYKLCDTYPAVLAFPATIDDTILAGASSFRSKGRVPTLSWRSMTNGCSICRCSQPLIGLGNNRSIEDERLLAEINRCNNAAKPLVIVDARPLLNARANQAAGKGVESEKTYENVNVMFMDIANIHAVRRSLEILEDACLDETSWHRNVENSGWLHHIRKILIAAGRIAHCVAHENLSVLVHCSDGWDRTSQLTSLSMLLLDEYYRTMDGFIVLVEKEWLSFGHKFGDRLGWTSDGWKDEERSPIFAQFLDCVHQIVVQLPHAFEFNTNLLLFLMEHISSGWFGNFLFNTERELKFYAREGGMLSIWAVVLGNRDEYTNPHFTPCASPVIPVVTRSRLVIWNEWFLRWHDVLWSMSWVDENQLVKTNKETAVIWQEDKAISVCMKCSITFTVFKRRHHCRNCGNIFCNNCTWHFRSLPHVCTWRLLRCCEDCARQVDMSLVDFNEMSKFSSYSVRDSMDEE